MKGFLTKILSITLAFAVLFATYFKNADNNLKKSQFDYSINNIVFLQTFFQTYVNLFEGLEQKVVPFTFYDPPFLEKDILVLHETFLL